MRDEKSKYYTYDDKGMVIKYKDTIIPSKKELLKNSILGYCNKIYYFINEDEYIDMNMTYEEFFLYTTFEFNEKVAKVISDYVDGA